MTGHRHQGKRMPAVFMRMIDTLRLRVAAQMSACRAPSPGLCKRARCSRAYVGFGGGYTIKMAVWRWVIYPRVQRIMFLVYRRTSALGTRPPSP